MERGTRRGVRGFGARAAAACAVLAAVFAASSAAEELPEVAARPPQWTLHDRSDDPAASYTVYRRPQPGSQVAAYRLEAVLDAPPDVVAEAAARSAADPDAAEPNMEKTVLREDAQVIVVYSYVHLPVVADRDVITRAERSSDPATGIHRMTWQATDEGPAPKPGVVRLTRSNGSWEFAPLPGGRTRVVYENHVDMGGAIPAWIIEPMLDDNVVQNYRQLVERVEREKRAHGAGRDAKPSG